MDIQVTWADDLLRAHQARCAQVRTPHGDFGLPNFMPVATRGAVKGILTRQLRELGAEILLSNTYHLYLRPGVEVIRSGPGGLRSFMGWDGPVLTDSGGYQVLSLSELRCVTDEGVEFRSMYDGSKHLFTPERVVEIQAQLGSTFMMQLDHLVPYGTDETTVIQAMDRTTRWFQRSRLALSRFPQAGMLVPILQGGFRPELRARHLEQLMAENPPAMMAIGGLAVGESRSEFEDTLAAIMEIFPRDRITYLMGVGEPENLLYAVGLGVDLFDCVLPTRNGRNAQVFTHQGKLNLRNARFREDQHPIEEDCRCPSCRTYSRAYLHHQFKIKEMNGPILASMHNLFFIFHLMEKFKSIILSQTARFPKILSEI